MKNDKYKNEFINRYKYLVNNILYIVDYNRFNPLEKSLLIKDLYKFSISDELLNSIEHFLLSDDSYQMKIFILEEYKNTLSQEYINKLNNNIINNKCLQRDTLNLLFSKLYDFVLRQGFKGQTLYNKLIVLEEYRKIFISNSENDEEYISWLNNIDPTIVHLFNFNNNQDGLVIYNNTDAYLETSRFIKYICSKNKKNISILSSLEKQSLYPNYDNGLPWTLECKCQREDTYFGKINPNFEDEIDFEPCGNLFYVKEDEIFTNNVSYYQLCPYCKHMVNIPSKLLPDKVKEKVNYKCLKDPNLYEKMHLYSQLYYLDSISTEDQKKLIKK